MKIKDFAQRHPTVRGAGLLFFAMMLTKFIGAVLKIPLTGLIGGLGMGYFSTVGGLFAPVYSLTTAGLPLVVTRVVAGYAHCGKYGGAVLLRRRF